MKNQIFSILGMASVLASTILTGCSEEQTMPVGEGTMFISTRLNSDVKVESRAADDLAESTIIWISNSEGAVRKYNGISEVPATGIKLIAGDYTIKAWAGKLEYASFESKWFEGEESVTLNAGDKQSINVECKIANVVTSVKYAEDIDEIISDYTLTVSHKGGSLTFEGADERKGYFMMPEDVTTLDYVFNATTEGKPIELRGTIENVEPAHEYVLNILTQSTAEDESGAGFLTIEVDDTMLDVADEVVITTPPAITGYGFDLSNPVAGESGSISRKSVYVCASSPLVSVEVTGMEGINDFDLVQAEASYLLDMQEKGIFCEIENPASGGQMMKISFDDIYLNTLENRDEPYVITIKAKDSGNKTAQAQLKLRISEAPAITNAVAPENIDYTSAVLEGQIAKNGVEVAGFEYRTKGTTDWQYVAAQGSRAGYAKGQVVYATVTGLAVEAATEYRMVTGTVENPIDFRAEIMEVTTKETPQLPYADMETWFSDPDTKASIPGAGTTDQFWDNGNHGSRTMGKDITTKSSLYKHSGSSSAELHSQFVGFGSIGKFACGNLFIGDYIDTDGTDGIVGFGRPLPFEMPEGLKLKSVKVWIKYIPQTVSNQKEVVKGSPLQQGDLDQGHIYVALFDGPDNGDSDSSNHGKFGYVVRTKEASRLFNNPKGTVNCCAYGEHIFTEATPGNGMVEIEIPFEYYAGKGEPKLLAVTFAASRYGDYFSGGRGTKMYVDDVRLVYEAK